MKEHKQKGGARPGAGRPKGAPNKASGEIKAIARQYGPAAIRKLARMAGLVGKKPAETEAVRVTAMRDLLDRGYGKPTQGIEIAPTEGFEVLLDRITGSNNR